MKPQTVMIKAVGEPKLLGREECSDVAKVDLLELSLDGCCCRGIDTGAASKAFAGFQIFHSQGCGLAVAARDLVNDFDSFFVPGLYPCDTLVIRRCQRR